MMAVIQEPLVGRRVPRAGLPLGALRQSANPPAVQFGPAILGIVIACVVYLTGCALLAQANFARVRLESQISMLRVQNNMLAEGLNEGRNKDRVVAWARQRGMDRAGRPPVCIGGEPRATEGR